MYRQGRKREQNEMEIDRKKGMVQKQKERWKEIVAYMSEIIEWTFTFPAKTVCIWSLTYFFSSFYPQLFVIHCNSMTHFYSGPETDSAAPIAGRFMTQKRPPGSKAMQLIYSFPLRSKATWLIHSLMPLTQG